MKRKRFWIALGFLVIFCFFTSFNLQAKDEKIVVLNPLGFPPPIPRTPMAPRLDTLSGKTVYLIDVQFPGTKPFLEEMQKLLSVRFTETKWILKEKKGAYFDDDPSLWAEIKEKAHAAVMAIGH